MVTHQLMSTRHLQLVKDKKTKDMNPPEGRKARNLCKNKNYEPLSILIKYNTTETSENE